MEYEDPSFCGREMPYSRRAVLASAGGGLLTSFPTYEAEGAAHPSASFLEQDDRVVPAAAGAVVAKLAAFEDSVVLNDGPRVGTRVQKGDLLFRISVHQTEQRNQIAESFAAAVRTRAQSCSRHEILEMRNRYEAQLNAAIAQERTLEAVPFSKLRKKPKRPKEEFQALAELWRARHHRLMLQAQGVRIRLELRLRVLALRAARRQLRLLREFGALWSKRLRLHAPIAGTVSKTVHRGEGVNEGCTFLEIIPDGASLHEGRIVYAPTSGFIQLSIVSGKASCRIASETTERKRLLVQDSREILSFYEKYMPQMRGAGSQSAIDLDASDLALERWEKKQEDIGGVGFDAAAMYTLPAADDPFPPPGDVGRSSYGTLLRYRWFAYYALCKSHVYSVRMAGELNKEAAVEMGTAREGFTTSQRQRAYASNWAKEMEAQELDAANNQLAAELIRHRSLCIELLERSEVGLSHIEQEINGSSINVGRPEDVFWLVADGDYVAAGQTLALSKVQT